MFVNFNACIFTLDQVFPAALLLSTGKKGGWEQVQGVLKVSHFCNQVLELLLVLNLSRKAGSEKRHTQQRPAACNTIINNKWHSGQITDSRLQHSDCDCNHKHQVFIINEVKHTFYRRYVMNQRRVCYPWGGRGRLPAEVTLGLLASLFGSARSSSSMSHWRHSLSWPEIWDTYLTVQHVKDIIHTTTYGWTFT